MNIIKTHTIINPNLTQLEKGFLSPSVLDGCLPEALIEWAARLCYVSNDKFGNSKNFIPGLIKSEHLDVLEHVSLTAELRFMLPEHRYYWVYHIKKQFPFLNIEISSDKALIWANLRVWKEVCDTEFVNFVDMFEWTDIQDLWFYLSYIAPNTIDISLWRDTLPEFVFQDYYSRANVRYLEMLSKDKNKFIPKITTETGAEITLIGFTPTECNNHYFHTVFQYGNVSRAFTAQHCRHRLMSQSEKSLRYTDARNAKFIRPPITNPEEEHILYTHFKETIKNYEILRETMKKEDARSILPLNTATSIITSGFSNGWEHYFKLRCAKDAQLEIRLAAMATKQLYETVGGVID